VVEVKGLGKKYGDRWILRDLSFTLETGDCLIVTGKNGAGKSTLLKVLSGLERPSSGSVETNTTDYRKELSYCALEQAMFATLTVAEHLDLAAKVRGIVSDDTALIVKCGLEDHKDVQSQFLSSGLRSRLKIALAIQTNPKVLLWDEPGVALDGAGKALIERVVREQKQRGLLVIATNDPDERRFGTHELDLA
jgi:ABC-type multidrug transport system ATPase subunit